MSSRAENTRLATIASRLEDTGLEKVYEINCRWMSLTMCLIFLFLGQFPISEILYA